MDKRDLALIRRNGGYWRPNSQGYTLLRHEAGRYYRAQAEAIQRDCEGITLSELAADDACGPITFEQLTAVAQQMRDALRYCVETGPFPYDGLNIPRKAISDYDRLTQPAIGNANDGGAK